MRSLFTTILFLLLTTYSFAQIGWVGGMSPMTGTVDQGTNYNVYIQVWKDGVTNNPGQGAGINCQVYYGKVSSFGGAWTQIDSLEMSYNTDIGNNDEYLGIMLPAAGLYEYTCRCSDNGGTSWTWRSGPNGQVTVNSIPLSVEWGDVNAIRKNGEIILTWATLAEINNSHFDIFQSMDGLSWNTIGTVVSKGLRNHGAKYQFNTTGDIDKAYFYKIVQNDRDGTQSTSETVYVSSDKSVFAPKINPNPITDQFILSGVESGMHISIYDLMGQKIVDFQDQDKHSFDVSNLRAGQYIITVTSQDGKSARKIVTKI